MNKNKGFTLVELLVVLVIVAILAAIATPIYLQNSKRSKAAEALGVMALIRQDEREFKVNKGGLTYDIASPNVINANPTSVTAAGVPTPATAGAGIEIGTALYFPAAAYTVYAGSDMLTTADAAAGVAISGLFTNPVAQNFIVYVDGSNTTSVDCTVANPTNCALKPTEVSTFRLAMDNTGRTFICYDACTTIGNWSAY